MMTKFFAGVLSVIAVGVLLIAYGLLNQRAAAFEPNAPTPEALALPPMLSSPASEHGVYDPRMAHALASVVAQSAAIPAGQIVTVPAPAAYSAPARLVPPSRTVERRSGRDWKKTALVVGGSTAAAAGLGGIFGGKKGALIGAAIGGGASTLYESAKK
jgi:hypothetical protein